MEETMKFGKYTFEVNKRDKIFFPESKYTKNDLMEYYEKIAETILPYMRDRPLVMIRFPDGINEKQFYQKDAPDYFPDWIELKAIEKQEGGITHYVVCNNKATLVYLASQACITPHLWLSRKDRLDYPDRLIFDLDPSDKDFSKVTFAAEKLKDLLTNNLGLPAFLMTTGSRGLHVTIPLQRRKDFDKIRDFAQAVAAFLEIQYPDKITTAARKEKRDNKLFIDTARNAFGQTAVAPYGVRPIKGAPVATPLEWNELEKSSLTSRQYNIKNIFKRLGEINDPWKDIDKHAATITEAQKKLAQITR